LESDKAHELNSLIVKTAAAGLIKGATAVVGFALMAVTTRTLGADESGLFLLGVSLLAALSIFFRLGLDNVVLRAVGAESLSLAAQSKLNTGLVWIALATVPFALLVCLFSGVVSVVVFNKPEFSVVLQYCMLALPIMALLTMLAPAFQGLHRVVAAVVFQNLGISLVFLFAFSVLFAFTPDFLNAESSAAIYALSAFLVLIVGLWLWFRQPKAQFIFPSIKNPEIWTASSNMWVASTMGLAVAYSGILVAGAYVAADELAYLIAAQRTALLVSFVLIVVNMVVAPHYARLWSEADVPAVRRLAKLSTRAMLVLALPVIVVMTLFSEFIMGVFGEGFEQGAQLLVIIAVGQLINVATGSVGFLLNMTGHERDMRNVTMYSGPLTIVFAVWFTSSWGIVGAAYAMALGLSLQNLGALWMVKRRLGFWPLG
jgi:O-antigen/teichoic acid export membrane protein